MSTGMRYIDDPESLIGGNAVTLLRHGREAFPAWLSAIDEAKTRISLEMYIFSDDKIGRRFADALLRAAKRGVTVRLLWDYVGSRLTPESFFRRLRDGGVHTIAYHRIRFWRPRFWQLWRRDHRKILVCDGRVAFVGGLNISDEWLDASEGGGGWHDAAVGIEGPAVAAIEGLFLATWNRRARKRARLVPEGVGKLPPAGDTRLAVVANAELRERFAIRRAGLSAARDADRRIYLANPYFVPDKGIVHALQAAARRGIDVRLLLPRVTDARILDLASRNVFEPLLRAGVRIWRSTAFIHTKMLVVDGSFVSLGSYNLDHRSLRYNLEVVVNMLDERFNGAAVGLFDEEMSACAELSLADFQRRSWFDRVLEKLAYALRRWL
ncbi:MAG TPA: phospholipase D-like domain-containing protein [Polyangia bacterium]|nr:phospholipase D-like domain-containing protein [Polyangia bacterium]